MLKISMKRRLDLSQMIFCLIGGVQVVAKIPPNQFFLPLSWYSGAFIDIFPRLAVKLYAFDVELLAVAHLYGLKVVGDVRIRQDGHLI